VFRFVVLTVNGIKMMDVSTASMRVGYLSVSQFSRDYRRFFGNSPSKDIERLRAHLGSGGTHVQV
jgi:AraC-like DNA-binding protein